MHTPTPSGELPTEVAALRTRIADLERAYARAWQQEAAMRSSLARLGHELNGPLSVLIPRLDLMLLDAEALALPPVVREDLAVLQRHVSRLARTAEAAPAAAESVGEPALVDVNAILRDALAVVTKPLEQRGIRVHLALADGLPAILGDPVALGQVVTNLLLNACETVPIGGAVWIETVGTDDRPPGARLVVRDDGGAGDRDEVRATLGGPFHANGSNGAAVGLSMVRGVGDGDCRWVILLPGPGAP